MEGNPDRQDQVLIPEDLTDSFQPIIGQAVTLRPLRPEDADIESAFLTGLSPETRHNRLLGGAIRITREYIERLTTVDFSKDVALAATVMLDNRETLIGVARYVRSSTDPTRAEFAVTVIDEWQHRGVGTELLRRLTQRAVEEDVSRFTAVILASNHEMRGLLDKLGGYGMTATPSSTIEVEGQLA